MAKHVTTTIIPDCPKCGRELQGVYRYKDSTEEHPFGGGVDGWWECRDCGYESEHFDAKPYTQEITTHEVTR